MSFLKRERETTERLCPGIDAALAAHPLAELEKPSGPGIELFRAHRGAGLMVSRELGGQGATAIEIIHVLRAIGARSPSLTVAATMHTISVAMVAVYRMYGSAGAEVLRNVAAKQLLIASGFAEGRSGVDIFDAAVMATPARGGYTVAGSKKPCSLSHSCDMVMVGLGLSHRPKQRGIALVLDARSRVQCREFWNTPVLAAADSHEVILENVFVPEELMVVPETESAPGRVEMIESGALSWFQLLISASYLGIASALVERVFQRKAGNDGERALLGIEIESAMSMLEGLAQRIETEPVATAILCQSLMVRFAVQQTIARVTAHAAELVGGMSFVRSGDIGYLLAASRPLAYHPPSRLSMNELMSSYLLGNAA
jgi:alkylation response protein AidB-like acyl-CoA dehydrogenase